MFATYLHCNHTIKKQVALKVHCTVHVANIYVHVQCMYVHVHIHVHNLNDCKDYVCSSFEINFKNFYHVHLSFYFVNFIFALYLILFIFYCIQNRREKKILALVIVFLCGNIYFVYYVFNDYKLLNWLVE